MGNNLSVDHEQPDIWWPSPHAEVQPEQPIFAAEASESCALPYKGEAHTEVQSCSMTSSPADMDVVDATAADPEDAEDDENSRRRRREAKLHQFKAELEKKHLARREAIAERSREMVFLREELAKYRQENEQLREMVHQGTRVETSASRLRSDAEENVEFDKLKLENDELKSQVSELTDKLGRSEELSQQNSELRKGIAETQKDLQTVNAQVLEFEKERQEYHSHVVALKDVIRVSKKLLEIRENQLQELKSKVSEIEASLAQREASMLSTNLREEYERQLRNIRALRTLYEQRQAAAKAERDVLASQLSDAKNSVEVEQKKNSDFEERIDELEGNVSAKYDEIKTLESQLGLAKAEYRGLQAEMSVINQLFSQILFGFNNCQEINFDKLIKLLQENHDLLTDIVVNEESQEISSALPKVLLDLVNQVNEEKHTSETPPCAENESVTFETSPAGSGSLLPTIPEENIADPQVNQMNSAEEIVTILPKVWRVLIELLRQQSGQQPVDINENGTDPCYKSVQTPKGPKLVLSVSQTFIRLKDLILEKKSLEKEMHRLKHLNTHLEVRLQDQEKRLETVSTELSKTWHVVGRMQRQHQQLHTHEKILRYELAQKRKMLTELKQELEYCREKWEQAREKNSNTEEEWRKLRTEFASRKATVADDINNSAESGYSDERECSSDDDVSFSGDTRHTKLQSTCHGGSGQTSDTDDNERMSPKSGNGEQKKNVQSEVEESTMVACSLEQGESACSTTKEAVQTGRQIVSLDKVEEECRSTNTERESSHRHEEEESCNADSANKESGISDNANSNIDEFSKTGTINTEKEEEPSNIDTTIQEEASSNIDTTNQDDESSNLDTTNQEEESSDIDAANQPNESSHVNTTNTEKISGNVDTTNKEEVSSNITNPEEDSSNIHTTSTDETERIADFSSNSPHNISSEEIPSETTDTKTDFDVQISADNSKTHEVQNSLGVEQYNALLNNALHIEHSLTSKPDDESAPAAPSSSTFAQNNKTPATTQDEMLSRREARLKRLEEQCQQLVTRVTNTTHRSTAICNRLETLHEQLTSDNANRLGETEPNDDEPNESN